jgi:hypothetical protein
MGCDSLGMTLKNCRCTHGGSPSESNHSLTPLWRQILEVVGADPAAGKSAMKFPSLGNRKLIVELDRGKPSIGIGDQVEAGIAV